MIVVRLLVVVLIQTQTLIIYHEEKSTSFQSLNVSINKINEQSEFETHNRELFFKCYHIC